MGGDEDYRFMRYSYKYATGLYEQYTQALLKEIDSDCLEKKQKDDSFDFEACAKLRKSLYGTTKLEEFKLNYHEYLNDLVKRSEIQ